MSDMPYKNREDRNRHQREVRDRLRHQVYEYLLEHPCIDCGESDPIVLEFDHLYDKKYQIARAVCMSTNWETVLSEIDKCVVRCSNCHKRKTARDFGYYAYMAAVAQR